MDWTGLGGRNAAATGKEAGQKFQEEAYRLCQLEPLQNTCCALSVIRSIPESRPRGMMAVDGRPLLDSSVGTSFEQRCSTQERGRSNVGLSPGDSLRKEVEVQSGPFGSQGVLLEASSSMARPRFKPLEKVTSAPALPAEMKRRIIQEVGRLPPDAFRIPPKALNALLSLSLVSKAFHAWTEPVLYRHVTVTYSDEDQLVALNNSLYNGAFRPPKKPLGFYVQSLLMMHSVAEMTPTDAALAELRSIMIWIAPYVQHILMAGGVRNGMCEVLETMPELHTLGYGISSATVQFPRLPQVKRLLLTLWGGFDGDAVTAAAATTMVEEIVLCIHERSVLILPGLVRGLLLNCSRLRRIVLIPGQGSLWLPMAVVPGTMATVPQVMQALLGDDPVVMKEFEGRIQVVRPPKSVMTHLFWSLNAIWSGAVWTLETTPVEKWIHER
ncbi:hypothetical protein FRB95_011842 [Tulasnella sp. JGI-2019a]|nr:hypothetical protein FRB95_011842 [Tulasnella sp. JGI-2019a]